MLMTFGEFGIHGASIDVFVADDGVEALATSDFVILDGVSETPVRSERRRV